MIQRTCCRGIRVKRLVASLVLLLALQGCLATAYPTGQVFVVRHAEKVNSSSDAVLSIQGQRRAIALAELLSDAGITHVHSTDFARTRDTAQPLADQIGVVLEIYSHRDLPGLVERVRQLGGRHLIVGHSNTTPEVVSLFGADPGSAIDEATEYDRLYVVSIDAGGKAQAILLRYGNSPIR